MEKKNKERKPFHFPVTPAEDCSIKNIKADNAESVNNAFLFKFNKQNVHIGIHCFFILPNDYIDLHICI